MEVPLQPLGLLGADFDGKIKYCPLGLERSIVKFSRNCWNILKPLYHIWRVIRNKLEDDKRINNNSYLLYTIDNQQPALDKR